MIKPKTMADKDDSSNNKSTMDKIVMGAIIGTAIGSAIGVTVAPKKGSETREDIKEHTKGIGKLAKETTTGLLKLGKRLLFGRKKTENSDMKKIPNEMEIIPPKYVDRD